jgi:septal ring factor EnvC (AmiA/AmiB activator)
MADEYDDVTRKLIDLKRSLESSQNATKNNEQNLKQLNTQLNSIKAQVNQLSAEIVKKQKEVRDGELALNYQKTILDQRTLSYYKNIDKNTFSILDIVLADNLSKVLENFFYQKTLLDEDKRTIIKIVTYIKDLEDKRNALQKEEAKLTAIKQAKRDRFTIQEFMQLKAQMERLVICIWSKLHK